MNKQTKKKLNKIGEMWFKRFKKLQSISINKHEPITRRQKAFELMLVMNDRLSKIKQVIKP